MEKLIRLRDSNLDLEKQEDRREFLRKLYPLIENWNGEIPDLGKMFKSKEINWLLMEDARCESKKAAFVDFAIQAEYKDEPDDDSDECANDRVFPSPKHRTTAVHVAASQKSPDMALIAKLFRIYRDGYDYRDAETGLTHLHAACMSAELVPVLARLLDLARSDPNARVRETGDTPLHLAARQRNHEAVNLLLKNGAEPMNRNHLGLSALHVLCQVDDDDGDARLREFFEVCEIVRARLDLQAVDRRGETPLHVALRWGNKRAAKLMLAKGADPFARNAEDLTPLRMIVGLGDRDFARMFYEMCCELGRIDDPHLVNNNVIDNDQKVDIFFKIQKLHDQRLAAELSFAIEYHHDMITVDRLVKGGANPNERDSMGRTPLHIVCQVDGNGATSLIGESLARLFFETCDEADRPLEIDARDRHGLTPLQWAVGRLLPETVELLLLRGADLANFCFPPRAIFFYDEVRPKDYGGSDRLEIAACAVNICDSLMGRGYKPTGEEVLTLMECLAQYGLFDGGDDSVWLHAESEEYRCVEKRLKRLFWPAVLLPYMQKKNYQLEMDRACEELEAMSCARLWNVYCAK